MEILDKLKPAQTYLIIENTYAQFRELLKYTFADLLLKRVLHIEGVDYQSHPNSPVRTVDYVRRGENFENYKSTSFEEVFLEPFRHEADLEMMFRHVVRSGFENASSLRKYVYEKLIDDNLVGCLEQGFLRRWFGKLSLTPKGLEMKGNVLLALEEAEKKLSEAMENDDTDCIRNLLKRIHGHVYLLHSFDKDFLNNLEKEFNNNGSSSFERFPVEFIYFEGYFSSFDSEYDSIDDGGWSGCSGDSGCSSGCSGCSGCGGCGD